MEAVVLPVPVEDAFRERPLRLRRAWPRGEDRLSLEYVDTTGAVVAGQWFGLPGGGVDRDRLWRVSEATRRSGPHFRVEVVGDHGLVLQAGGADRRMTGLAPVMAAPGSTLVAHRAERRAVVRLDGPWEGPVAGEDPQRRYAKVLRPGRSAGPAAVAVAVGAPLGLRAPRLLVHAVRRGTLVWAGLAGRSLHDLLAGSEGVAEAAGRLGVALRSLHEVPPPDVLPQRDSAAETAWLQVWVERVCAWAPANRAELETRLRQVSGLLSDGSGPLVTVHADLHDQQVILAPDGGLGVLDWDTAAAGEPAHDLANLLVHLELRAATAHCTPARAAETAAAILDGYAPDAALQSRVAAYSAAIRLRLACQYAFRPGRPELLAALMSAPARPDG